MGYDINELFLATVGDATHSSKLREIFCSCGRTSYLSWNGEKYIELTGNWKFRTSEEAEEYKCSSGQHISGGWYCGEPDHEQKV